MISWIRELVNLNRGRVSSNDERTASSLLTTKMLALDFELTSLSIDSAHITSAGWVAGTGLRIEPHTSFYTTVRVSQSLEQSPVIHGLTDTALESGKPISSLMKQLYPLLGGHVLLCHHARLEVGLLCRLAHQLQLAETTLVVVDTMQLAGYLFKKQGSTLSQDTLTLDNCRKRYKLPDAPMHNALTDAKACYELWLAQLSELGVKPDATVTALSHTGALSLKKIGKNAYK